MSAALFPSGVEAYGALARLLDVAITDTGQGRRCANFVLAWWNAGQNGGFDLSDLWNVDDRLTSDMTTVFAYVARTPGGTYPVDYRDEIERVIALHRPAAEAA
ncbi:DUF7673 family protein [Chenggangzhangella methanolivorans]|uniref:DUF7673 domain-containing protein n=1 Tax=Chenggangzhangella methanolivorans TaxID=1437009 RepID=A0A9E6RE60_9HYPH|nr:hypothetical protein [Chenggangzhangella methanolivorans]QZN99510.1 hypothetical protein K6K41_22820 [Chenggangzhangella methanolivorans]